MVDVEEIPPGYGSLKQDEVAIHLTGSGVMIRLLPLSESVIRALTPDSYRSMHDLKKSYAKRIVSSAFRFGGRKASVWLVSFYGVEPEARFTAMDISIQSGGREFRPSDIISLTASFDNSRVRQRETHSALYIFSGDVNVTQPLTATYQGARSEGWDNTLQIIERERAMILARSSKDKQ